MSKESKMKCTHLIIDMNLKLYYLFWVCFGVITILKFHVKSLNIYKICIGYVGTGSVLPLNAMVEAAPWVHGFVNSQQHRAVYLPLRLHTHLNLW